VTSPDDAAVRPVLDELGRIAFAEHSLASVLTTVTTLASRVLPGEPVASVTVIADGRPTTVASSGQLALDLDIEQYRLGSGPCLTAAGTGEAAQLVDTRRAAEWAEFGRLAADRGCGSVLSFPLPGRERVAGALNLYAWRFSVHDARTRDRVVRVADRAVVPVANMYLYESAVQRAEHLAAALDSRPVIEQAKGVLMERYRLTADAAFQALTRVSMETNTKVRDVAERFVTTGELPRS
jgi:hypothetical protein